MQSRGLFRFWKKLSILISKDPYDEVPVEKMRYL